MDITATVSDNLRATRERMKLSLDTVAKMTGVSKSMLAQIERGEVNPTISVLWKIANGLKVSFTSLLETRKEELEVIKASAVDPIVEDDGRFINQPVFGFDDERRFESFRIVIQGGGSRESQAHLAGTEEYITVFFGQSPRHRLRRRLCPLRRRLAPFPFRRRPLLPQRLEIRVRTIDDHLVRPFLIFDFMGASAETASRPRRSGFPLVVCGSRRKARAAKLPLQSLAQETRSGAERTRSSCSPSANCESLAQETRSGAWWKLLTCAFSLRCERAGESLARR